MEEPRDHYEPRCACDHSAQRAAAARDWGDLLDEPADAWGEPVTTEID